MDNNQNLKTIFSCNPFEIIKQYKNKHNGKDKNIYSSQEYKYFQNTVQQPFTDFCYLIHQQIPCEIAATNFYKIASNKLFEIDFTILVSPYKISLHKYLDIFSLLYIELRDTSIIIKCIDGAGAFLARKIGEKNPVIIANLIALNVTAFDFASNGDSCYFNQKEILNSSKEELINKFNKWF